MHRPCTDDLKSLNSFHRIAARVWPLENYTCRFPCSKGPCFNNCDNRTAAHAAKIEILRHIFVSKDADEFVSLDLN